MTFESLEDRRVLAALDLTASLTSPGEPIIKSSPPTSIAHNLGDFYYSGSEQIPLLRYEDQFVVRIAEASLRDGIVSALTASGAPFAGYSLVSAINSTTLIMANATDQPVFPIALTLAESVTGVEWVTPLFQAGAGGAWIAVNDEVIVALKPGVAAADFFGADFSSWRPLLGTPDQFVAILADGAGLESLALANTLHTHSAVQWAAPNFYADVQRSFTPSDPLFSSQWHLNNTGQTGAKVDADSDLTAAWDITQGSSDVVIAVLDDGVQTNHPDLNIFTNPGEIAGNGFDDDGNGWIDDINGWNFVIDENPANDNNPNPSNADDNHGTAVAGVAAAKGNTTGVSGSSRNARILPIKVFDGAAFVGYARAAEALYYAAGRTANGLGTWDAADIVNMSFGTINMTSHPAFDTAVTWATSSGRQGLGASIFAAAGNNAAGTDQAPAYRHFTLSGFAPGNYVLEWRYEKDGTVSAGDDTVWLANVQLPNGAMQRFDTLGIPTGWSTTASNGQFNSLWDVIDDPANSYGTGRYVARSGDISDSQITRFRSPQISVTSNGVLEYDAWVSSESGYDFLRLYVSINGGAFIPQSEASGVPTVVAAVSYPANLTNAIAVGASTDWDYRAAYSQYGAALDLVAPSGGGYADIPTTDRTGAAGYSSTSDYATFSGTSSATPLTAGIAALMLSKNPNLSPTQIRTILQNSADKIGGNNGATAYVGGFNQYYGYGRVNAHAALLATPTVAPTSIDLAPVTDTGSFDNDDLTNRDNSSAAKNLQFIVSGTVVGAVVKLYAGSTLIGSATANSATTTVTTSGTFDLLDGGQTITAKQTESGRPESTGVALSITIDTIAPAAPSTPDLFNLDDSGLSDSDNRTRLSKPRFTGTAQPLMAIRLYDGAAPISLGYANSSGAWNIGVIVDLSHGTHNIRAEVGDAAGNLASSASIPVFVDLVAPKISDVRIYGTSWTGHAPYSFASLVNLDDPNSPGQQSQQLRPIATLNVNQIQIQFSEPVFMRDASGAVVDIDGRVLELKYTVRDPTDDTADHYSILGDSASVSNFSYDSFSNTATWTFLNPLPDGKYAIHLAAGGNASPLSVADVAGSDLDGEYDNLIGTDTSGRPTADNYKDDPRRAFGTGNGFAGSIDTDGDGDEEFRFHFALLAGDYNGDGIVTSADVPIANNLQTDGDGDGVAETQANSDDYAVRTANLDDFLPLRRARGGDFRDDDVLIASDVAIWASGMGSVQGDADGDGDTDGDDFLFWQRIVSSYSAWSNSPLPGGLGAMTAIGLPPQVMNVIFSGSISTHAAFSMDTVDGSGSQIATVPVGGADTISIVFSENVNVSAESLFVVGMQSANLPTLAEFAYVPLTHTATWRFEGWSLGDQYLLALSDAVTDEEGNWLDGEWTNPASIATVNAAVSEFPSGDGDPGGWFNFVVTLLPGDANTDGVVDGLDFNILAVHYGQTINQQFDTGDFNGDGAVDVLDYSALSSNFNRNLQTLWLKADFDEDGDVDHDDLDVIVDNANMTGATWADGDLDGDGEVTVDDLDLAFAQFGRWLNVVA